MINYLKKNKCMIFSWIGIIVALYLMTFLQVPTAVKDLFMVGTTSACLYLIWKSNQEEKWEVFILVVGLLARIVFCYLDACTDFSLPFGGGDDGITFFKTAVEYCNGNFERQYTRYPYVLYALFQITGIDQFAAQYANVFCWGLAMFLMQKSCKRLDITGLLRVFALLAMAWLPTNIWITSILYRDTIIMLLLFMSFYFLLCWMQEKNIYNIIFSIVTVLLATLLHGGSIISLLPIVLVLVFYSLEKQQFMVTRKRGIVGGVLILCVVTVFLIPQTREMILTRIPYLRGNIVDGLNSFLVMKYDYSSEAGSNYLVGRYVTGYFDIVVMTAQRIYYHVLSPAPDMWRGMADAIAFFGSTAPIYLISLVFYLISLFYHKKDAYRFVMFVTIFITVGLYAWANVNAGAALRHREKITGLVILLGIYSLKLILQNRKEHKDVDEITEN